MVILILEGMDSRAAESETESGEVGSKAVVPQLYEKGEFSQGDEEVKGSVVGSMGRSGHL